ncbi:hypothetical protein SESBI_33174 [Sesbania bispinosa]|nr:hypothetical protein SESBI_33174 [Sesbania bispinosa]
MVIRRRRRVKSSKGFIRRRYVKFIKGEFCLDQCLKDAQVTYLQQISLLQFLQKDVVPAAERAKENYDKALKASAATEECAKIIGEEERSSHCSIGDDREGEGRPGAEAGGDGLVEEERWRASARICLIAEERRKEDLRKQQEIHDAEVAELKRKWRLLLWRGSASRCPTRLRYVEKAFDVAIEQVKVRNPDL